MNLEEGYWFKYGKPLEFNEDVAFFEKSFINEDWRIIPEDENLRKERDGLIIREPFTELYVCNPGIFITQPPTKKEPPISKNIREELDKMIAEGTLPTKCEKKI